MTQRIALVTGGMGGLGEAICMKLARMGVKVVVTYSPGNVKHEAWLKEMADRDYHFSAYPADVADYDSCVKMVDQVSKEVGPIDILINNAGIGAIGTVADNPDAEWHRVFDVNVVGMVRASRAALPYLRQSAHAAIVNTCSIAATAGLPQRALYAATKGAVLSLTLAMAADHIGEGIRVNCVNPGTADTPWVGRLLAQAADPAAERAALESRQPMGRMVTADEVAASIAYLASPAAAAITGTALAVDGGMAGLRLRPRS